MPKVYTAAEIVKRFERFRGMGGGIESWIRPEEGGLNGTPAVVLDRLSKIEADPLSKSQLSQLLILSHEGGISSGFFEYYWVRDPVQGDLCNYNASAMQGYDPLHYRGRAASHIGSLEKLEFGLQRLFVDGLLYFGNIRQAYRELRVKTFDDIRAFFYARRFDHSRMRARGAPLEIDQIPAEERFLIAEIACKTFDPDIPEGDTLKDVLRRFLKDVPLDKPTWRKLVRGYSEHESAQHDWDQLEFTLEEKLDDEVDDAEIDAHLTRLVERFTRCRDRGVENTRRYLSLVSELDVYVATSMRKREQFRAVAKFCADVFGDERAKALQLRHFDPTLSAAEGHEDKGLIECLMVKASKALVYIADKSDSFGKDAEAAMALSQGKPVVMYCDQATKARIFRDVHPLTRLIEFETGVAVGALVATSQHEVALLLEEIFTNNLTYELKKRRRNLQLVEKRTGSTVRLQTADPLLRETFWNYYHARSE